MNEVQIQKTVNFLSNRFRNITRSLGVVAQKDGNAIERQLYEWQVEFSYIIDDIQRGFNYSRVASIAEANSFLGEVERRIK